MAKEWPALLVEAPDVGDYADRLSAILDDCAPAAIEDLAEMPLPAGGLWDPTFPPIPEPPPAPLRWRVFFSNAFDRDRAALAVFNSCPELTLSNFEVDDEDWAARSQAGLTAVEAGRFIVAPPWAVPPDTPAGRTLVVIEPSMGFGTGHHPTTRLCLRLLSNLDLQRTRVIDIGTGSGVLAMAAALSGAAEVVGLDIDLDAIESARTSAALNPLPPTIRFESGDFRESAPPAADVVLANLTGVMLRATASALIALKRPGGALIVGGFEGSEADAVRTAFGTLREIERLEEAGWVALRLA